jgi:galactokinase
MNSAHTDSAPEGQEATRSFSAHSGQEATRTFFAPGRVNLIGEHLDYNGGPVLPAAIDRGLWAVVRPRPDRLWHLSSGAQQNGLELDLDALPAPDAVEGWGRHVAGMLALLARSGLQPPGLDIAIRSDLPQASGLSSSAALEMLIGVVACAAAGREPDGTALALTAQAVEAEYLGLNCGIMDPYAIAHGQPGKALLLDCAALSHRLVPAELPGYTWVILDTRLPRQLRHSAYNQRRAACEQAASTLGLDRLADLRDPDRLRELPGEALRAAARHVYSEVQRVHEAAACLESGRAAELGRLLNASHASLRDDFRVSCPELDLLADAASQHSACAGARMTGAGFGGCALALVQQEGLRAFADELISRYAGIFSYEPGIFPVRLSGGAREITGSQAERPCPA